LGELAPVAEGPALAGSRAAALALAPSGAADAILAALDREP
jgi:hypothetical protein